MTTPAPTDVLVAIVIVGYDSDLQKHLDDKVMAILEIDPAEVRGATSLENAAMRVADKLRLKPGAKVRRVGHKVRVEVQRVNR